MRWAVQMAVLAAFVAAFAMQIPKSALFFRPVAVKGTVPMAAFVTLSDAAYARLMRQVHAVSRLGVSHGWSDGGMSTGTDSFVLDDPPPLPPGLPLPEAFMVSMAPAATEPPMLRASLQPVSLAMPPMPPIPAKAAAAPPSEKRQDALLDIDSFESLKETKERK